MSTAHDSQLRRLATLLQTALDEGVEHTGLAVAIQYHLDNDALTIDKARELGFLLEGRIAAHRRNNKEAAA